MAINGIFLRKSFPDLDVTWPSHSFGYVVIPLASALLFALSLTLITVIIDEAMKANDFLRKRSFAQVTDSISFSDLHECHRNVSAFVETVWSFEDKTGDCGRAVSTKRRSVVGDFRPKMTVQTNSPSMTVACPSLISVFGGMGPNLKLGIQEDDTSLAQTLDHAPQFHVSAPQPPVAFLHRESVSTVTSESTDSSPTTTISTFDSPSVTDTSPSSSPESPSPIPLMYPKPMDVPNSTESEPPPLARDSTSNLLPLPSPVRAVSPGRRARNLKNLSLRVPAQSSRPAISTAAVMETGFHHLSAPPSPVIRPSKTVRRRPANLTIRTPALDRAFSSRIAEIVPPTPHRQPSLRHTESSPSLPAIFSPTTAPLGGMQLPRPSTRDGMQVIPGAVQEDVSPESSGAGRSFSFREVLQNVKEEDFNLDTKESSKPNELGYPDGPIQIYDSGVFLYLEPTAAEASKFDVVVNVAKEVANPFTKHMTGEDSVVSVLRTASIPSSPQSTAEPRTAISEASFHSAFEFLPAAPETPTTPKASKPVPEYIHVPWDHNSEIVDDLLPLCELINDRVSKAKTVLIHCQLGVSRSASLVIAYGLYKNRHLDFSAMYSIVKAKSSWVGPNMSLIYQLTDFRGRLLRGGPSKPVPAEWFECAPDDHPSGPQLAQEASKPFIENTRHVGIRQDDPYNLLSPVPLLFPTPMTNRPLADLPLAAAFAPLRLPMFSAQRKRTVSPRPLPLREKYQLADPSRDRPISKPEIWKTIAPRPAPVQMDLVMQDVPAPPSILSPRAAGFMTTTISRAFAGDFAGDISSRLFGVGDNPTNDPRSPPQRTEPLIMRNIDEFLSERKPLHQSYVKGPRRNN